MLLNGGTRAPYLAYISFLRKDSIHIYSCIYTCMCVCIYTYIYIHIYIYIHVYMYMYILLHGSTRVPYLADKSLLRKDFIHIDYLHIHVCVNIYVCIYIYIYIYMCIYTYIHEGTRAPYLADNSLLRKDLTRTYSYIYTFMCIYIYMYKFTYIFQIFIYTHT